MVNSFKTFPPGGISRYALSSSPPALIVARSCSSGLSEKLDTESPSVTASLP